MNIHQFALGCRSKYDLVSDLQVITSETIIFIRTAFICPDGLNIYIYIYVPRSSGSRTRCAFLENAHAIKEEWSTYQRVTTKAYKPKAVGEGSRGLYKHLLRKYAVR